MSHQPSSSAGHYALQPLVSPPPHRPSKTPGPRNMFSYPRRGSSSSLQNPFQDARMRERLLRSYALDWVMTVSLAGMFFALDRVSGFKREFSLDDTSLRHPYTIHERVPDFALFIISVIAPLCLQPVINYFTVRSYWDLHNSTLGLILGLGMAGAVTEITKLTVGRPRPDLIARCIPQPGSEDPTWGLSSVEICTQTDWYIINDGFRSFPSGHSSMSFAGLGFLSFYLAGKLHLFDQMGYAPKAWLALTPLCGAALVAISRTMDYRHHWQDVLAGSVLGLTLAYFSYRQYYPSLASKVSHRPYAPRIKHEGPILPVHRDGGSVSGTVRSEHEMNGSHPLQSEVPYRDALESEEGEEDELVPQGTVPRPERPNVTSLWKDEDEDEHGMNGQHS